MVNIDNIPQGSDLILHKRVNPDLYEVHVEQIQQESNLLFSTTNGEFAERFVLVFNKLQKEKGHASEHTRHS